jgi:hypothetical protein
MTINTIYRIYQSNYVCLSWISRRRNQWAQGWDLQQIKLDVPRLYMGKTRWNLDHLTLRLVEWFHELLTRYEGQTWHLIWAENSIKTIIMDGLNATEGILELGPEYPSFKTWLQVRVGLLHGGERDSLSCHGVGRIGRSGTVSPRAAFNRRVWERLRGFSIGHLVGLWWSAPPLAVSFFEWIEYSSHKNDKHDGGGDRPCLPSKQEPSCAGERMWKMTIHFQRWI